MITGTHNGGGDGKCYINYGESDQMVSNSVKNGELKVCIFEFGAYWPWNAPCAKHGAHTTVKLWMVIVHTCLLIALFYLHKQSVFGKNLTNLMTSIVLYSSKRKKNTTAIANLMQISRLLHILKTEILNRFITLFTCTVTLTTTKKKH